MNFEASRQIEQMIQGLSTTSREIFDEKRREIIKGLEDERYNLYMNIYDCINDNFDQSKISYHKALELSRAVSEMAYNEFGRPIEWIKLEKDLDLQKQYENQKRILSVNRILTKLESDELGIFGINDTTYPLPDLEDIAKTIDLEKAMMLAEKKEQGFTKLIIVPFGAKLSGLIENYKITYMGHNVAGRLHKSNGKPIKANRDFPVTADKIFRDADTDEKMLYYPTGKYEDYGKSKFQILSETGRAWNIVLIRDVIDWPSLPTTQGGREDFSPELAAHKYLQQIKSREYRGESFFTLEDWLMTSLTYLEEQQIPIDQVGQGKACMAVGSVIPDPPLATHPRCSLNSTGQELRIEDASFTMSHETTTRSAVIIN